MASSGNYNYSGSELDIFAHAVNWKSYWSGLIYNYIKGDVLEVGAGNGNNTEALHNDKISRWVCLEPDNELANQLSRRIFNKENAVKIEVIHGTITSIDNKEQFDAIIYIDVLEHIEDDKDELNKASMRLNPGGHIIIMAPALPYLYSEFDKVIGHFRRYTKSSVRNIVPDDMQIERLMYLDTIGVLASLANRLLLRQSNPGLKQIKFWDRMIIPCSKLVDRLLFYSYGKSILTVLKKKT